MPVGYRFADADELWLFVSELRGPVSLALDELDESERAAVRAEIESRARRTNAGFELGGVSLNVVTSPRARYHASSSGALAEWLGSGLQSRLQRFESARRLTFRGIVFGRSPPPVRGIGCCRQLAHLGQWENFPQYAIA